MDRQALIGFVLIALVLIIWMTINAPPPPSQEQKSAQDTTESLTLPEQRPAQEPKREPAALPKEALGKYFATTQEPEKIFLIETDLYVAEVTTRGGLIRKWELKNYNTWDGWPVQMVDFDKEGDFSLLFTSSDGKLIDTRDLTFNADLPHWHHAVLGDNDTLSIDFVLPATNGGRIVKRYSFHNKRYSFNATVKFERMEEVISGFEYQVVWETGLRYAELNSIDESSFAMAYAYSGKELADIDATSHTEPAKMNISGLTDWVATRNKYFAVAIIPQEKKSQGAYLEGIAQKLPDDGMKESYNIGLLIPYKGEDKEASFTVYLGPLDFDIIKSYDVDLDQIMSLGAAWIIRPISEWIIIPLFQFLRSFIPNYGIVIILFSIIIKIALHPLTKTSMKSMKKMQALQPMMQEIREKYKDDPQKMNRQIMQLYKDYGVNPAGGCLPILLQLPILYALWTVFRSAIELRQAHFVWWITDLSIPDVIVQLPAAIPLFGIKEVSGLALLMGITMFIQQKMTIKDPRQKMMVWLMPIFLTLLFNSFPSGLNLYYFVFNLLSIGQQFWINKQHGDQPLKKVEGKKKTGGIMNRLTKDLPRLKR